MLFIKACFFRLFIYPNKKTDRFPVPSSGRPPPPRCFLSTECSCSYNRANCKGGTIPPRPLGVVSSGSAAIPFPDDSLNFFFLFLRRV